MEEKKNREQQICIFHYLVGQKREGKTGPQIFFPYITQKIGKKSVDKGAKKENFIHPLICLLNQTNESYIYFLSIHFSILVSCNQTHMVKNINIF